MRRRRSRNNLPLPRQQCFKRKRKHPGRTAVNPPSCPSEASQALGEGGCCQDASDALLEALYADLFDQLDAVPE